jgi:transcriptional antiterminator NusG
MLGIKPMSEQDINVEDIAVDDDEGEDEVVSLAVDEEEASASELDVAEDEEDASDLDIDGDEDEVVSLAVDEEEASASELDVAEDEEEEEASDSDSDEVEEETPRPDGTEWYVIHSYSGYENKVQKNLEHRIDSMSMHDQIFQIVVPTEEEVELRDGQRRTIERRVFPGYILVEMLLNEDSWYVVRNTPGVTGFVGSGNNPTPLRQEEVDNILKRMDAEAPKIKVSFKVGQKVRIVEGPFEDFMGTVDEIDFDRTRVRVLVNFFGRETPIELDFLQVERA